jgi:hypothetical protein
MMAIGFLLFIVGLLCWSIIGRSEFCWDWRDLISTLPIVVGFVLVLTSVVVWMWRVAP